MRGEIERSTGRNARCSELSSITRLGNSLGMDVVATCCSDGETKCTTSSLFLMGRFMFLGSAAGENCQVIHLRMYCIPSSLARQDYTLHKALLPMSVGYTLQSKQFNN